MYRAIVRADGGGADPRDDRPAVPAHAGTRTPGRAVADDHTPPEVRDADGPGRAIIGPGRARARSSPGTGHATGFTGITPVALVHRSQVSLTTTGSELFGVRATEVAATKAPSPPARTERLARGGGLRAVLAVALAARSKDAEWISPLPFRSRDRSDRSDQRRPNQEGPRGLCRFGRLSGVGPSRRERSERRGDRKRWEAWQAAGIDPTHEGAQQPLPQHLRRGVQQLPISCCPAYHPALRRAAPEGQQ
jgi:hypothetical protein